MNHKFKSFIMKNNFTFYIIYSNPFDMDNN